MMVYDWKNALWSYTIHYVYLWVIRSSRPDSVQLGVWKMPRISFCFSQVFTYYSDTKACYLQGGPWRRIFFVAKPVNLSIGFLWKNSANVLLTGYKNSFMGFCAGGYWYSLILVTDCSFLLQDRQFCHCAEGKKTCAAHGPETILSVPETIDDPFRHPEDTILTNSTY